MALSRWPSAELRFVIDACAPAPSTPSVPYNIDWQQVHQLANRHRVLPRVWKHAAQVIPADHAGPLREQAAQHAQNNLGLLARTIEVVQLLEQQGIESIVLKGPLLAQRLYGDFALRVCADVDLLVAPDRFPDAAQLLAAAGYHHHTALDAAALARHRRTQHDLAFAHPLDNTLIELHADVAQPHYGFHMPLEAWWQDRLHVQVAGQRLGMLRDEHAYLMVLLHAAKHRWHRLDLVADLAAFGTLPLDWAAIRRSTQRTGMVRALATGQALAAHFFSDDGALGNRLVRRLAQRTVQGKDAARWAGIWLDIQLRERWRDRARYLYGRTIRPALQ